MRTSKNEILNSSACLGRVLIVTGDHIIRDFLGQILKLHGYDCEYLEELPKARMEQTWKGFDALFVESHSLEQFKRGMRYGVSHASGFPMVVVLGDLPPSEESGLFPGAEKTVGLSPDGKSHG